jgi:hypothetical protein
MNGAVAKAMVGDLEVWGCTGMYSVSMERRRARWLTCEVGCGSVPVHEGNAVMDGQFTVNMDAVGCGEGVCGDGWVWSRIKDGGK